MGLGRSEKLRVAASAAAEKDKVAPVAAVAVLGKIAASKADKTLQKMKKNPQSDWTIGDMQGVANAIGLTMTPPSRGSHFKVSSRHLPGILTVPAAKPIKPPYVRKFVSLSLAHIENDAKEDKNG
jgi:hypothetical protein